MPGLPASSSKAKVIQAGNGESVSYSFIIPTIITAQGHIFEKYTMVSEIHDKVYLIIGIEIFMELE